MALVGYDVSDDSDADLDEEKKTGISVICNDFINCYNARTVNDENVDEEEILLAKCEASFLPESSSDDEDELVKVTFSNLPKPNYHAFSAAEIKTRNSKLESLTKIVSKHSRNSKSEYRNDQKLNFKKETGLLSALPKPVNETSSVVPKVLGIPSKLIPAAVKSVTSQISRNEKTNTSSTAKINDDDDDIGNDFFSLLETNLSKELTNDVDLYPLVIESDETSDYFPQPLPSFTVGEKTEKIDDKLSQKDDNNSQILLDLDEETLQKIRGRKRKGQIPDNIQLIDINEADVLAESKKVASKHFTDEVMCNPAPKRSCASTLSKRKHQITYLAFQAKERELELKNQWATNRASRKQTQSKYGF